MTTRPKKDVSFALMFPALELLVSFGLIVVLAARLYIAFTTGSGPVTVAKGKEASLAINFTAVALERPFRALHTPGMLMQPLIGFIVARNPDWRPGVLDRLTWDTLVLPFYAIPGWFFAGRGLDGFLHRTRLRIPEAIISFMLSAGFLFLGGGLVVEEHEWGWPIFGLIVWVPYLGLPFAGWLRQRRAARKARAAAAA